MLIYDYMMLYIGRRRIDLGPLVINPNPLPKRLSHQPDDPSTLEAPAALAVAG